MNFCTITDVRLKFTITYSNTLKNKLTITLNFVTDMSYNFQILHFFFSNNKVIKFY